MSVAGTSTAVWLSDIASIAGENGNMGLANRLDEALAQAKASLRTVVVTFVIYDLPNRDCSSDASHGELTVAGGGLTTYETQYIDAIAAILKDPAYNTLRIAAVIEPDSIPNLVTNVGLTPPVPLCDEASSSGAYVQGIRSAINQLHPIPNLYVYADIGQSGWLGWSLRNATNASTDAVNTYYSVLSNTDAGVYSIDGVVSNTSNYVPTAETFLPNPNLYIGVAGAWNGVTGGPVDSVAFYGWNGFIDEETYAKTFRNALVAKGFPSSLSVLIDTGRNGWGSSTRPTAVTGPADLSTIDPVTYVNENKIDQRAARSQWCNQTGAGLGARPHAWPTPDITAYVWIKPPGESDGTYDTTAVSDPSLGRPNVQHEQRRASRRASCWPLV